MDDPRFTKLFSDPKFRNVPKKERKVKIDNRFQSLFKDKKFVSKVSVDKRGRPGNYSTKENYEKFYQMESDDESSDDEEEEEVMKKKPKTVKEAIKDKSVDYARGEAVLSDSSSEEESSAAESESDEETTKDQAFDKWGELDHDAESTEEATKRLAVCNMDWDRVGADDLFLVLSSFCTSKGQLLKVSIYPSEFGKQRMAEEDNLGPQELRTAGSKSDSSDSEDDELNEKKDYEKVRKYQINRLKYYYAVAEFNTIEAANHVYSQCDGSEYELSATRFDLRFIPEEMEFNDDPPKEVCNRPPQADQYKPKLFSTTALTLGKVDLTWDETDPQRIAAMKKAFDDDNDDDAIRKYIATSSEEEDENNEENNQDVVAKYRALLSGSGAADDGETQTKSKDKESDDDDMDMEMTFVPEADQKKAEALKEVEKMTPWEQYLHKKKEKKKAKKVNNKQEVPEVESSDDELPSDVDLSDPFFKDLKKQPAENKAKKVNPKKRKVEEEKGENLELLTMDSDDDRKHFDYKEIVKNEGKKKNKKKQKKQKTNMNEDNFRMDLNDERFGAVFNNPKYNVDPSHPSFKKTKSMQTIIEEKQKRILSQDKLMEDKPDQEETSSKKPIMQDKSLLRLVSSVQSKSKSMKKKRKRN